MRHKYGSDLNNTDVDMPKAEIESKIVVGINKSDNWGLSGKSYN